MIAKLDREDDAVVSEQKNNKSKHETYFAHHYWMFCLYVHYKFRHINSLKIMHAPALNLGIRHCV